MNADDAGAVVHELAEHRFPVPEDHPVRDLVACLETILVTVAGIEQRLVTIEGNTATIPALVAELDELRPLLAKFKQRAERGSWAERFGNNGKDTAR